jgi:hypothetical protein
MNKKYFLLAILLAVAVGTTRAAETQTMTVASVSDLASLFEGEFTTAPVGNSPQSNTPVLYNFSKRVHMPSLGDEVVYAEQRAKTPEGPIVWQRLYAFKFDMSEKLIVMTPYNISTNGHTVEGVYKDPTPLAKLDSNALKPQVGGCIMFWHRSENGFEGMLKPGTCKEADETAKSTTPAIVVTKTDYTEQPPLEGMTKPVTFRRLR